MSQLDNIREDEFNINDEKIIFRKKELDVKNVEGFIYKENNCIEILHIRYFTAIIIFLSFFISPCLALLIIYIELTTFRKYELAVESKDKRYFMNKLVLTGTNEKKEADILFKIAEKYNK